jgi:hypothetical protein
MDKPAMDMVSIGQAIYETCQRIRSGTNVLYKHARAYAEAEHEYRMVLAKEIMQLRDAGQPVTIINDVARGNVADLKFKRDLAELTYKTTRDMLQALQTEMSGLQTLYKRQEEI